MGEYYEINLLRESENENNTWETIYIKIDGDKSSIIKHLPKEFRPTVESIQKMDRNKLRKIIDEEGRK